MKVFGKKFKKALGSSIDFLFEVFSVFSPENILKTDKLLYELSNPFRLKYFEILITGNYNVHSILEDLRKEAGISGDIVLLGDISLEKVIRRIVPPTPKKKIEYIKALREAASGKLDVDKYRIRRMKHNVGSGVRFTGFSESSDGIEHVIYDLHKGIGVENIDFKKVLRYKGTFDSETVENTYCKLYEPEEKECKNPQRKCKNCSVYHGFKGSGRL